MLKLIGCFAFCLMIMGCVNKNNDKTAGSAIQKEIRLKVVTAKQNSEPVYMSVDSTLYPFKDKKYKAKFHIAGEYIAELDGYRGAEEQNNAVLTFVHVENNVEKVIFRDSLSCMNAGFEFKDFNNDKVKDLMVFHFVGGRANPTYYLYLVDPMKKKLIRVKGFEQIPNAELDTANNIIYGMALYGGNVDYSYQRINRDHKLIELHAPVTDDMEGELSATMVKKIIKKWGRN